MNKRIIFFTIIFFIASLSLEAFAATPVFDEKEREFITEAYSISPTLRPVDWPKLAKRNRGIITDEFLDKLEKSIDASLRAKRDQGAFYLAYLADVCAETVHKKSDYRLGLAWYYIKSDRGGEAIDICNNIRLTHPNDPNIELALAASVDANGDSAGAYPMYLDVVRRAPKNEAARIYLGKFYMKMNEYDRAKEQLTKAIEINPNSEAVGLLAQLESERKLKLAEVKTPTVSTPVNVEETFSPEAKELIADGNRLLEENNLELAASSFNQALAINKNSISAIEGLASVYLRKKEYNDAIPILENAVKISPTNPVLHRLLGTAYEQKAEGTGVILFLDQAIAEYEEAVRLNPEDGISQFYIKRVQEKKGNF
ncbi:MAG: tetratricopeptide repeat protein [Chloroflexi bacterium]|nr:tetratricopeptide repeat protein [Chloroflexota bacterium]